MKLFIAVTALLYGLLPLASAQLKLTPTEFTRLHLASDFKPPPVFKNTNLVRNTNLEKGYVRETVNVVVENIDNKPQDNYFLSFPTQVYSKVGALDVRDKRAPEKGRFDVIPSDLDGSRWVCNGFVRSSLCFLLIILLEMLSTPLLNCPNHSLQHHRLL